MEKFSVNVESVATGTDKTAINLFNPVATPLTRARVFFISVGGTGTPSDESASFVFQRTSALGTEGSGLVPHNVDPGGPAGEYDSGLGVFGAEPTYTSAKIFLRLPANHRITAQWYSNPGCEFILAATQNNGGGLKSTVSTATQAYGSTILFEV